MSLRLHEELARHVHELVEITAGADMRIDLRIDRVDADAQALERRCKELRADLFRQHETIGAHTRLGEEADGIVDARVEKRLAHLVQPLQLEAEAVDVALGLLDERPFHVLVRTAKHRQRAHAAAQIALRRQLQADFDGTRDRAHWLSKSLKTAAYSDHEYIRALSAARRSMVARSDSKKRSIAFASASGSSGGTKNSLSTISGSPPTLLAITGRAK